MRNSNLDSKVLILGGGPVGLFTALQLCQLDVPVRIIDEAPKTNQSSAHFEPTSTPTLLSSSSSCTSYDCYGTILLLSPRSLQLLQSLDLLDDVIAHGVKHWQLQIYASTTPSTPTPAPFTAAAPLSTIPSPNAFDATNLPLDAVYSYKLWENRASDHNYCLSIERSKLCHLLEMALSKKYNIHVEYDCKLVDLQYGGGLGNTMFVENELDSDFYLRGMDSMATATGLNSSIQPLIATIQCQEKQPGHRQDCIQVCQTSYLVAAAGKSNIVRQKLAEKQLQARHNERQWQPRLQRQLSVKSTVSYKKSIGDDEANGIDRPHCYSLVAKIKTNYPELKPLSIVAKTEGTLIFLVHNNYISMMIQQKKRSANEPLSLIKLQKLIQRLFYPYDIEFLDTYDYCYWKDSIDSTVGSDAPNMDTRLFFLGDASHDTHPPGWLSPDLGFEQAINLCWKLNLHMQQRSTPQLLDTYYNETQIKKKDASLASNILLRLLHDPITITKGGGMAKLLQGHRHCFIGGLLLENNVLNHKCPQTPKVQRGSIGTLAPNARLKPYHLSQLLTQQSSLHYAKSPKATSTNVSQPPKHSSSTDGDTHNQHVDQGTTNKLKFLRGLFNFPSSKKSQVLTSPSTNTITPTNVTAPTNDKWKGIRANHYHLWDQLPSHTGPSSSRSTFTILVLCGSLLDYNSTAALRKLKKHLDQSTSFLRSFEYPHHQYSYQQQQQQPLNQSKSTPIQRAGSITSINNTTTSFSPATPAPSSSLSSSSSSSKILPQPRRSESSSSFYSVRSTISSTDESIVNDPQHQVSRDSHGASLKSPRSSIFTRFSTTSSADRYSMATTISNSSIMSYANSTPPPPVPPLPSSLESKFGIPSSKIYHQNQPLPTTRRESSSPLFSFLCLTTSSKLQCSRFLSEQTPYSLHQLFPFGLARTFLDHDQEAHQLYAMKDNKPTIVVIRPDGYVGAQMTLDDSHLHELDRYFDQILLPVVDFSSAASLVADDYCL